MKESPVATETIPSGTRSPPAAYPVTLPAGTEVRVGNAVYKILTARLDRYAPDKLSLKFQVRMTNNGRFDANFWVASFRLLVDGVLRAPDNFLDELVESHSAKEGKEIIAPILRKKAVNLIHRSPAAAEREGVQQEEQ